MSKLLSPFVLVE
jgi:regulator of protease activity HflC (stomatin/prohibitin superfamily)